MLLYFISFLLIVSFFVLNMFVGVVVENFHKCRQHQEAEEARRREEKRLRRLEKKRRSEWAAAGWGPLDPRPRCPGFGRKSGPHLTLLGLWSWKGTKDTVPVPWSGPFSQLLPAQCPSVFTGVLGWHHRPPERGPKWSSPG